MKQFLKRYFIFIFLSFLVVILIALKLIYKENNQNEIIKITPTPTIINEDINNVGDITEEDPTLYLQDLLPYEEENFIVKNYIEGKVLLVKAKTSDIKKAEEDLRKWLNSVEDRLGENEIVWEK